MALRVGFNAIPLLSPLTGIGNYIVHLGAALHASREVDTHSFYGVHWRHEPPTAPLLRAREPAVQAFRDVVERGVPFKREMRDACRRLTFGRGLRRHAIDVYHEPNYVPLSYDVPVVVTVHDLSWLRYPDTHPADRVRWLERGVPRAMDRAAAVLVDSEFVRQELLSTFSVAPQRVHVAHLGVGPEFRQRSCKETAGTLHAIQLDHGKYLLSVGTIEPRKNVGHVLASYALLPNAIRERYPLVIAGVRGWRAGDLERRLRVLAERGQIRFLGHVHAGALPDLYAGAAAFLFPSLYEGFGLPPLEAMASGVPVLASNRASMPEVIGDAGLTIDAQRPEDTSSKIQSLLEDPIAHAELARRGKERACRFTWKACAQTTAKVYFSALAGSAAMPKSPGHRL